MANPVPDTFSSKIKRPPQITIGLDRETNLLCVNRDLAGTGFDRLTAEASGSLHALLHSDCNGECRFNRLFRKAWSSLMRGRGSVEWEIDDAVQDKRLRINLSRPPITNATALERRRWAAWAIITDITEIRREYELLLVGNKELLRRVDELEGVVADNSGTGETANASATSERALHELSSKILAAQEQERRRIASDLHDGVAQTLGVVKYSVESRIAQLERDNPGLDLRQFESVIDQIREAVDDIRKISRNLSPSVLDEFGICVAIDMLCRDFESEVPAINIDCRACVDEIGLPEIVKVAIYRVVQEALNNIQKYASARQVEVAVAAGDDELSLLIRDDGEGFDAAEVLLGSDQQRGMGLVSMKERVEVTGGTFQLESSPGKGTAIVATWPRLALKLLRDQPVLDSV
jgi:signal transduction histidine kinase